MRKYNNLIIQAKAQLQEDGVKLNKSQYKITLQEDGDKLNKNQFKITLQEVGANLMIILQNKKDLAFNLFRMKKGLREIGMKISSQMDGEVVSKTKLNQAGI